MMESPTGLQLARRCRAEAERYQQAGQANKSLRRLINRQRKPPLQWFTPLLLAWLILLSLAAGAKGYSTVNPDSSLMKLDPIPIPPAQEDRDVPAQATTLAPFMNILPNEDGTSIFIEAREVGQLEGEVFANLDFGAGGNQGSYTMSYSDTIRGYVTLAPGLSSGSSEEGTLSLTTTEGLTTGTSLLNITAILTAPTGIQEIFVEDLKVTLNPNTLPTNTSLAIIRSFAPPGPAPQGHSFVGKAYSVRASGGRTNTDAPMRLALNYDASTLAGADPHTLAIFAWDAVNQRWNNLGGTLKSGDSLVEVSTTRLTTYVLMTTLNWRDGFYDESGLATSNNLEISDEGLVLINTPGSGSATSQLITLPVEADYWDRLTFSATTSPSTTLAVDILDSTGGVIRSNVSSGTSLATLNPNTYPSLKLRVRMNSTSTGQTPTLSRWQLSWKPNYKFYLPFISSENDSPNDFPIDIEPSLPTQVDIIHIRPHGIWPNSCEPTYSSHQIAGQVINIYGSIPPVGVGCAGVIVPWGFTVNVGPLPSGTYTVNVYIIRQGEVTPHVSSTEVFQVVPAAQVR